LAFPITFSFHYSFCFLFHPVHFLKELNVVFFGGRFPVNIDLERVLEWVPVSKRQIKIELTESFLLIFFLLLAVEFFI
jgi:hypothetical protein